MDSPPAVVHDLVSCSAERRASFVNGMWLGAFLALCLSLGMGIGAARWQERGFDQQMRLVQAQHRNEIELERKRVARYAEIDALARQYDAMAGR